MIFIHLKILEFPLKNYFLEEINKKVDGFDKIFLLKKINFNQHSNNNINQMGNFSFFNPIINNNANNFSYLNNNLIQNNISENIANLKQRNNDLEKMLNEEKNKNKKLIEENENLKQKLTELNNKLNNFNKLEEKIKSLENQIKNKILNYKNINKQKIIMMKIYLVH